MFASPMHAGVLVGVSIEPGYLTLELALELSVPLLEIACASIDTILYLICK